MGLTKQFTQFYVSAKDKISGQEIEDIFESVTKASASMGLSAEQTERAFLALNQMMSKGTVSAEELRGQLGEALPGAFGIMAKAMGVTEKQLGKMMKDGEVLASDVLPKFARQLEITYGIENVKRIDNIVNAQNRLGNSWTDLVATFAEGDGVLSRGTKSIMNAMASDLDKLNELMKSSAQKRKDQLKELSAITEATAVEQVQKMQQRGDSEIKIQEYINRAIDKFTKDRFETYVKAKALENEIASSWDEVSRKRDMKELARLNDIIAKRTGLIEGLKKFRNPEQDVKETEDKTDKKEKVVRRERIEALELQKSKVDSLILSLEKEKAMIEELQIANSDNNEEWLMYQKVIDQVQTSIDNIKNGFKDLHDSAMLATDGLKANEEAVQSGKDKVDLYNQTVKDTLEIFQSEFFSEAGFPTLFKALNDDILGFGENFAVTFNTITEIAQEAFNYIANLSNQRFQSQYENLAKEKEVALMFAGESASAREEVERQFEEKQKAIRKREFQAQKRMALFNIAVNGAQAIIATLARTPLPFGLPLVLATSALTAVQLGVVASQKIPEFWKGTDNAPEGLALTQERGREIITDSRGNIKSLGSDKGAELTYLNKGDKVFNTDKTMEMLMFDNSLNNMLNNSGISMPNIEVNTPKLDLQPVIDAIKNKDSVVFNYDQNGARISRVTENQTIEYANRRAQGIGKIF
jgi:tape measure domain-containing protein